MSDEVSSLINLRIEKIENLKKKGINPYPVRYFKNDTANEIKENFKDEESKEVNIAGRIKSKRLDF